MVFMKTYKVSRRSISTKRLHNYIAQALENLKLDKPIDFDQKLDFVGAALCNAKEQNCPSHYNFTGQFNELLRFMMNMDFVKEMILDVTKQGEMVESMAAAGEENAATIEHISNFVHTSAQSAVSATETAEHGVALSDTTLQKINQAHKNILDTHQLVLAVNQQTDEIDSLTAIIKSVADQTNLLALNASIEAARAGTAGRGFAVVADAIKKLSQSTTESVAYISDHLGSMRNGIKQSTDSIEGLIETFTDCKEDVEQLFENVEDIKKSVESINGNMQEIRASVEEQSAASEEMSSSLVVINEKTKQLHSQCIKTGQGFHDISSLIDGYRNRMIGMLDHMKDIDAIDFCITDHLNWKWRIYNMILGYDKIDLATVGDHHACRLGKWIETKGAKNPALTNFIKRLNAPHEQLHQLAARAVKSYNEGDVATAEDILEHMDQTSKDIISILQDMIDTCR